MKSSMSEKQAKSNLNFKYLAREMKSRARYFKYLARDFISRARYLKFRFDLASFFRISCAGVHGAHGRAHAGLWLRLILRLLSTPWRAYGSV